MSFLLHKQAGLCLCICTYRRADLLRLLIQDLGNQSMRPETLVVVDGDPGNRSVPLVIEDISWLRDIRAIYVPANHANLSYQRYLGWKAAKNLNSEILLYLDDDLRLMRCDAVEMVVCPLENDQELIVGCTAEIREAPAKLDSESQMLGDRQQAAHRAKPFIVSLLGAGKGLPPGSLSPAGSRIASARTANPYSKVDWLHGRVMSYRMDALRADCFSHDLFALDEVKSCLGEDTVLSHRVRSRGAMLYLWGDHFFHPSTALPNAYPTAALKLGFTTAFSRRFVNDNYRWPVAPKLADRLALWKSYAGNVLLNAFRALRSPRSHRFAFAWGYFLGAIKGVCQPPSYQRLTPHIDWQKDAAAALSQRVNLTQKS